LRGFCADAVPRVRRGENWEIALRVGVRSSTGRGWSLREQDGITRLEKRVTGTPRETVALPFRWEQQAVGAILARVRNIYLLTLQGHGLQEAARIADGKAANTGTDWGAALESFKRQKLEHGAAIKATTWRQTYVPVLTMALEVLQGPKPPGQAIDLMDGCLRGWAPGSRMRQIRAQSLSQFLRHCVEREHFPECWRPPADLKACVGIAAAASAPGHRKGDPLTDLEVLALVDALPQNAAGRRWADVVRLLAELGLRPVELVHLSVRQEPGSGEWIWWCGYRKRSGGGMTAPRRVYPLPLTDWDGRRVQWNLMERWRAGLVELPPLPSPSGVADAVGTYLKRQKGWQALMERLASRGERAVPYSFRHGYSLRAHQLGIDTGSVALSMGHSLEVHLRSYPWSSGSTAAAAFARASSERQPETERREV